MDWDDIYTRNWHHIHHCVPLFKEKGNVEITQFTSRMAHLPHGNNVEWIEKIGPLPYGMCYDLDCDEFFDENGIFNFEAWEKDDDYKHKHLFSFTCQSFCSRGLHKCGYALFSEILQDGLEMWLNGTVPPETVQGPRDTQIHGLAFKFF
jgi:hypothetical protein